MKSSLLLGFFLMAGFFAVAQNTVISGAVADSVSGNPLLHATVVLQQLPDSTLVGAALTDDRGSFRLSGRFSGQFHLSISYLGYRPYSRTLSIGEGAREMDLGVLLMEPQDFKLQEVTVREDRIPVTIKKDTLEFDAGAFKVRENAVVEELLKKLPGLEVERDGTVRAMGERVSEVTVDGNPFFGGDPQMATKNLPADIVDKVQVIDKKSEQAQFTGMDDGNTQKSINLKLKKDKKNGFFGNAELGGGTQERFAGKANLNRFRGPDQLSLVGGGNNINELGLSIQDAMTFGALDAFGTSGGSQGGGMVIRMSPGGGGGGASLPGSNTGITTAWNGGLNFRENWGSKLTAGGSYLFNQAGTDNEQVRQRENLLGDGSTFTYSETGQSANDRYAHRVNLNLEYVIDSLNSLQFKPYFSLTGTHSDLLTDYASRNTEGALLNSGLSSSLTDQQMPTGRGELLYKRRFSRPGRTFSAFLGGGFELLDGEQHNESMNHYYLPDGQVDTDTIRQFATQDNNTARGRSRLVYTEPLGRNKQLEFFYELEKTWQNANRETFDYNPITGEFDRPNELFTNRFQNEFTINEGGVNLRFQKLRYDFTLGVRAQQSAISSVTPGEETSFRTSFFNVFPQLLFNYNFSTSRRLRITYRPNTRQPTLNELQPVPDNSNPQYIKLGNPELKPEFAHRFDVNYNFFDLASLRSLFVVASFTATANKIVNSNYINEVGRQVSQPVNVQGAYDGNAFLALGLPFKGSAFRLNLSTQLRFERYANLIDAAENVARTFVARQTLRLGYMLEEKFDAGLAANAAYNVATYSLQGFLNNEYFNYGVSLDFNWELPLGFRLQSDVDFSVNAGGTDVYNNSAVILNATLGKDFLPKQQVTVELRAFDLLNQNNNIIRNTGENFIEDIRNTTLNQYFMLRLRYRFGAFGGEGFGGHRGGGMRMIRF